MDLLLAVVTFALKPAEDGAAWGAVRVQLAIIPEEIASDDAMKECIKSNCVAVYHPVGPASMLECGEYYRFLCLSVGWS